MLKIEKKDMQADIVVLEIAGRITLGTDSKQLEWALESLIAEATSAPQQRLIADTVDLVVFVDPESSLASGRKVRDLLLVTGWKDGWYEVQHV